jgi:hypothetical protein
MRYKLIVGIEHLMTGIQFHPADYIGELPPLQFERESASTMAVLALAPFMATWVDDIRIMATTEDAGIPMCSTSAGEIEYIANVVAGAMQDAEQLSADRRGYTTPAWQRTDWPTFTPEVIASMRRKFGKHANEWLGQLQWDRDHWFFIRNDVYHGVEPDGHIHT